MVQCATKDKIVLQCRAMMVDVALQLGVVAKAEGTLQRMAVIAYTTLQHRMNFYFYFFSCCNE
jgi:hypothetical protein